MMIIDLLLLNRIKEFNAVKIHNDIYDDVLSHFYAKLLKLSLVVYLLICLLSELCFV